MARRGGLGKGLGALIPTEAAARRRPAALAGDAGRPSIRPNPHQPREHFDEEALAALAESIREVGRAPAGPGARRSGDGSYELIAGERRWRAARRVGLQTIPAHRPRQPTTSPSLEQALVENLHREDLNPLEEAAAYQQLIEDFGLTHDEVADAGRQEPGRRSPTRCACSSCRRRSSSCVRSGQLSAGPRPGPARHARPRVPGGAGPAGRGRGPVGARGRGGGPRARASRRRDGAEAARAAGAGRGAEAPAAGPARARGAARRPPRHPGEGHDGRRRGARSSIEFADPRGPRAHLPGHDRRRSTARAACRTRRPTVHSLCVRLWTRWGQTRSSCSPRRPWRGDRLGKRLALHDERPGWSELTHDRGHSRLGAIPGASSRDRGRRWAGPARART